MTHAFKGVVLYAALAIFILAFPVLLGSLIWPLGGGGGLVGMLSALGLRWAAGLMSLVFTACIAMMLVAAFLNAYGTFNFKAHVRDIVPFALGFWLIIWAANTIGR